MKGGWIAVALLAAACGGDGSETDAAVSSDSMAAVAATAAENARRIQAGLPFEGGYVLVSARGGALPATMAQSGECQVELLEGSLHLEAGRFAFTEWTREVCGAVAGDRVMQAAGGTYAAEGERVTLSTDVGAAFTEAVATRDSTGLFIGMVVTATSADSVLWRFQRVPDGAR